MLIPELTIFIIDDNKTVCESLSWLLKSSTGLKVVTYHDARVFLQDYRADWYGCLLVDVLLPGMSGIELLRELKTRGNQMPVIILTGHGDIPTAVQAMQAGANDFITKPFNADQLLEKIQKLLDGYKNYWIKHQQHIQHFASLTRREHEVMKYITAGKLNKQIADELGIAVKTVELHRFNIMHKLQVKSVAELVAIQYMLKKSG